MATIQGKVNKDFCQVVGHKFKLYCDRNEIDPTPENMAKYLLAHNIIRERDASKYMIIEKYPSYLYDTNSKRGAVLAMEDDFPYQYRRIWSIVGDPKQFRKNQDIQFS